MPTDENPFASPTVEDAAQPAAETRFSEAEKSRLKHLNREAWARSFGEAFCLAAIIFGSGALMLAVASIWGGQSSNAASILAPGAVLAVALWLIGSGTRRLAPWAPVPIGLIGLGGLFGAILVPPIAVVCAYMLYQTFSAKGRMVFSLDYQKTIRETPHIECRTSGGVMLFWSFVFTAVAMAVLWAAIFWIVGRFAASLSCEQWSPIT